METFELLHKDLTKDVLKLFYVVYNELGYGFLEKIYQNAMIIELKSRGYTIENQKKISVIYKNEIVGDYIPDIIINNSVIIEPYYHRRLHYCGDQ